MKGGGGGMIESVWEGGYERVVMINRINYYEQL